MHEDMKSFAEQSFKKYHEFAEYEVDLMEEPFLFDNLIIRNPTVSSIPRYYEDIKLHWMSIAKT